MNIKPVLTYEPLIEKNFSSRNQPATLSQQSSKALIQGGFQKIGYISLNLLKKTCVHYELGGQDIPRKCTTFHHNQPIPLLSEKGQAMGGDLIVIEFEKPYTEIMNMMARDGYYRKEFSAITAAVWRKKD